MKNIPVYRIIKSSNKCARFDWSNRVHYIPIKHAHYVMQYFVPLWSFLFYNRNEKIKHLGIFKTAPKISMHSARKNLYVFYHLKIASTSATKNLVGELEEIKKNISYLVADSVVSDSANSRKY